MLADEICQTGIDQFDGRRTASTLRAIAQAQKYVLAPQFAAVADAMSEDFGSLVRAFPFCRLPYPKVWIEVVHQDRPRFASSAIHAPSFQSTPRRVGYLCTATRDDLSAWKTHLFWNLPSRETGQYFCNGAAMAINYDMTQTLDKKVTAKDVLDDKDWDRGLDRRVFTNVIDTNKGWERSKEAVRLAILQHTHPCATDYGFPEPTGLRPEQYQQFYETIGQLARSDWAGECTYLLAVIGLMNARNAVERTTTDISKLNRARKKRGDLPLFEHHVIKIHTRQQKRVLDGTTNNHVAMRGHFVSGHWKVRKSGIFFWHPYKRGDFSLGRVHKDYELSD